jgi:hypothetical protein
VCRGSSSGQRDHSVTGGGGAGGGPAVGVKGLQTDPEMLGDRGPGDFSPDQG